MWPLEPLQPFWGHEGRHQCHILGVKAQRTPGSWVVAPNLELPCLDLLVIVKESESENYVTRSCPTLCDSVDCSPPGSSIHGILQARILEWVAISFSRGSSWPRDWAQVSCIAGKRFNSNNSNCGLSKWFSGKNPPATAGDAGLIPGSGRSPGGGNGTLRHRSF